MSTSASRALAKRYINLVAAAFIVVCVFAFVSAVGLALMSVWSLEDDDLQNKLWATWGICFAPPLVVLGATTWWFNDIIGSRY